MRTYAIYDHQAGCIAAPLYTGITTLTEALATLAREAAVLREDGYYVEGSATRTKCYTYGSRKGDAVNNLYIEREEEEEELPIPTATDGEPRVWTNEEHNMPATQPEPTNISATTYCQDDYPGAQVYGYGSAYGHDVASFLADLTQHEDYCRHQRRRVVRIDVSATGERTRISYDSFADVFAAYAPQDDAAKRSPFTSFDCAKCGAMAPCVPKGQIWCETCRDRFSTYPRIPVEATIFQHGYGYQEPTAIHAWQWRPNYGHWGAVVTFADGWHGVTSPRPYDNPPPSGPGSHSDQDINRHNAAEEPSFEVTSTGVQYLLPGQSPTPARKGDATEQRRMF